METMTEPEAIPKFVDIIPGERLVRGVVSALKEKLALDIDWDIKDAEELPETGAEAFIEEELGYNEGECGDMPDIPEDVCFTCFKTGDMCKCE